MPPCYQKDSISRRCFPYIFHIGNFSCTARGYCELSKVSPEIAFSCEEIGSRLKQLRQQASISQERFAEAIGVSTQQLQKYENGQNMMNTEKLQLVATALSVPVQALFSIADKFLPMGETEKLLIDSFRAILNKEIQESILKITTNATKQRV
jgi:transcriptional regulator with XRE-family HTH domain